jgi:hypothetical protein
LLLAIDVHRVSASAPLPHPALVPGPLRHIVRLSGSFTHQNSTFSYPHVYAAPARLGAQTWLEFLYAADTGVEGIACVDDAARAAILACEIYQEQRAPAARHLAQSWLDFVLYMQQPDGRFVNFILDGAGHKNLDGRTSYAGGRWWTARAMWALATGWRVLGDERYIDAFQRGRLSGTADLKVTALQALALMELYASEPSDAIRRRVLRRCDRIVAAMPDYFLDHKETKTLRPWGYHQLQAVARAGRLFSRVDYLAACERTVKRVVAPLLARDFAATKPWEHAPRCAYDISTLVLGIEELYRATGSPRHRDQALACAEWLYGRNPAEAAIYDPRTGWCADGIDGGVPSSNCGAESAIEAGFVELARHRLLTHTPRRYHAIVRVPAGRRRIASAQR